MLAVDIRTRRIVGFAAHAGDVNRIIACRLLNRIPGDLSPPVGISTDHDPIFKHHRWQATLRILDVDEVKTVPYTPLSHPFVERTIGTVRREVLDQTLIWNEADLSRKLDLPLQWSIQDTDCLLDLEFAPHTRLDMRLSVTKIRTGSGFNLRGRVQRNGNA
jgi:hypothetical protein